jgi:hypothetical protein
MDIIDFPNYLIYDDGKVYNKKRKIFMKHICNLRYKYITLRDNGISKKFTIHRLVAIHYIPNPNNLPTVDHIDRDKDNNNVSNLRWADMKTQCQNRSQSKMVSNNTTGHKNIYHDKQRNKWRFGYNKHQKRFNNKIDAICYKYVYFLKMRISLPVPRASV